MFQIDRLLTLKELHERGASLLNSVADIEASQNSIKAELTGLRDAMKMVCTSLLLLPRINCTITWSTSRHTGGALLIHYINCQESDVFDYS